MPEASHAIISSAIIAAFNEGNTVRSVVQSVAETVDEVLVVDSCSTDTTASEARRAGARVIRVSEPGKHHALRAGVQAARGNELVFMDADLINPSHGMARALLRHLRHNSEISLVKGFYERYYIDKLSEGGRLTEICARPLIAMFFPGLSYIRQPLSGEFAVRRTDLLDMPFAPGFGVDLGILIHCAAKGRIAQVDLGVKRHKHRPLLDLGRAAVDVSSTILRAAGLDFSAVTLRQFCGDSSLESRISLTPLPPLNDNG